MPLTRCPTLVSFTSCHHNGVGGSLHRWLTDHLSNRTLQVVVGGATSRPFPVAAGVPQGSILSPTLCLVYVNDDDAGILPDSVYPATYADDTTLYSTLSSAESSATECQKSQMGVKNHLLAHWGATWKIQFERSKSQAMVISRHKKRLGHPSNQLQWPRCR